MDRRKFSHTMLICISMLALMAGVGLPSRAGEKTAAPLQLENHPIYSTYDFGADENVIDVGIQPLAAPLGVAAEVMRRDRILRRAMGARKMQVRFHPFLKGPDINYFAQRGQIDAAMTGDTPTLVMAATEDVVVAALVKQGHTALISKKRFPMSELKGKRIGYVAGSTAQYNLLIAFHTEGIEEADVHLAPMELHELAEALETDRVDAIAAFQPVSDAVLAKHRDYTTQQKFMSSNYLYFMKKTADRHREETLLLLASYLRALRWMKKDKQNLMTAAAWNVAARIKLQKKPSEATAEQIAEITRKEILQIAEAPFIPLNDLEQSGAIYKAFTFLQAKKMIPPSAAWSTVRASLDRGLMSAVLAKPRTYRLNDFDYDRE